MMASNSETGHTKNVANLKTLNKYLGSLGTKYNPTKASITLTRHRSTFKSLRQQAMGKLQTSNSKPQSRFL